MNTDPGHAGQPRGDDITTAQLPSLEAMRRFVVVPASVPVSSVRPDLVAIPLDGVEPGHVVLATRMDDHGRLVTPFRKCARSHLPAM